MQRYPQQDLGSGGVGRLAPEEIPAPTSYPPPPTPTSTPAPALSTLASAIQRQQDSPAASYTTPYSALSTLSTAAQRQDSPAAGLYTTPYAVKTTGSGFYSVPSYSVNTYNYSPHGSNGSSITSSPDTFSDQLSPHKDTSSYSMDMGDYGHYYAPPSMGGLQPLQTLQPSSGSLAASPLQGGARNGGLYGEMNGYAVNGGGGGGYGGYDTTPVESRFHTPTYIGPRPSDLIGEPYPSYAHAAAASAVHGTMHGSMLPGSYDDVGPECVSCGSKTTTRKWRADNRGQLLCNTCGVYNRMHQEEQPGQPQHRGGGGKTSKRASSSRRDLACSNCNATETVLWRRNEKGEPVCNPCGLYFKLHKQSRPISMRKDVIQPRKRKGKGSKKGDPATMPSETESSKPRVKSVKPDSTSVDVQSAPTPATTVAPPSYAASDPGTSVSAAFMPVPHTFTQFPAVNNHSNNAGDDNGDISPQHMREEWNVNNEFNPYLQQKQQQQPQQQQHLQQQHLQQQLHQQQQQQPHQHSPNGFKELIPFPGAVEQWNGVNGVNGVKKEDYHQLVNASMQQLQQQQHPHSPYGGRLSSEN